MILSESSRIISLNQSVASFHGVDSNLGVSIIQESTTTDQEDKYFDSLVVQYQREGKDLADVSVDLNEISQLKIDLMDVPKLLFKFLIFQERLIHTVKFKFDYSFTQNQGLKNEYVHHKSIEETIELKSESPF